MIITETQRFLYILLALALVTIAIFVLLDVYALELFLVLIILEFLVVVELTHPPLFRAAWRRNITVFVVVCLIVFLVILYQKALLFLP